MDSIPSGKPRGVQLHEGLLRYTLQRALIEQYRSTARYRNRINVDLRAASWRPLVDRYGWGHRTTWDTVADLADEQRWAEEDGDDAYDRDLRAYVESVHWTVAQMMGLRRAGEPAIWSLPYVHADVSADRGRGVPLDPAFAWFRAPEAFSLTVTVGADAARLTIIDAEGGALEEIELAASPPALFSNWDRLREELDALIDRQLNHLIKAVADSRSSPGYYRPTFTKWQDDLILLADVLAHGGRVSTLSEATRKRLTRLAMILHIDPPR